MKPIINYQPWLQAVLSNAKHYRIEPSEERIRLQLDWNPNQSVDDVLALITRQIGMNIRKVPFSLDVFNAWRLPVVIEMYDGQVAVIDKMDSEGRVSLQLSGDEGLAQVFTVETLQEHIRQVYIIRPEKSVPD
ncbi:MAG: type I secretion system permease/ATPase, partial [Acinetobacter sp.]